MQERVNEKEHDINEKKRTMDVTELLHSRPILAYQLDATHLQNVLIRLSKGQDELAANALAERERARAVERAVQDLNDRLTRVEGALHSLGNADEVRLLKDQLVDVCSVVDRISQRDLPDMQRRVGDAAAAVDRAARQAVHEAMQPLEQRANAVLAEAKHEMGVAAQEQRSVAAQLQRELRKAADEAGASRGIAQQREVIEALREINTRVDHVERNVANPLRDALAEMQDNANINFKQIEMTTKLFDNEIAKLKAEMANLRGDLNMFENGVTNNVAKIREDLDTKFQMLIQMMQSFERNNQLFEQAVSEAGAKLGAARQQAVAASMSQFRSAGPVPVGAAAQATPLSSVRGSMR